IALGDYARVVANDLPEVVIAQEKTKFKGNVDANKAVARAGHVHHDDLSADQFRGITRIRQLKVLLGRQCMRGCSHTLALEGRKERRLPTSSLYRRRAPGAAKMPGRNGSRRTKSDAAE